MAQHGLLAAGEEGPLLDRVWWRDRMTHQVHASMNLVKAPVAEAHRDLMPADARGTQLMPGDHAVLACCERRDYVICESSE